MALHGYYKSQITQFTAAPDAHFFFNRQQKFKVILTKLHILKISCVGFNDTTHQWLVKQYFKSCAWCNLNLKQHELKLIKIQFFVKTCYYGVFCNLNLLWLIKSNRYFSNIIRNISVLTNTHRKPIFCNTDLMSIQGSNYLFF